jgi:hypothetical protein
MTFDFSNNKLLHRFKDERMAVNEWELGELGLLSERPSRQHKCIGTPNSVILALKTKISLGIISIIL